MMANISFQLQLTSTVWHSSLICYSSANGCSCKINKLFCKYLNTLTRLQCTGRCGG